MYGRSSGSSNSKNKTKFINRKQMLPPMGDSSPSIEGPKTTEEEFETVITEIENNVPLFLKEPLRIDIFLKSLKGPLAHFSDYPIKGTFIVFLQNAIHFHKRCSVAYRALYRALASYLIEVDSSSIANYKSFYETTETGKKWNYEKIITNLGTYFQSPNKDFSFLNQSFIKNIFDDFKLSIINFYEHLEKCKYYILSNSGFLSAKSTKVPLKVSSTDIIEFISFKEVMYNNIIHAFRDIIDISTLNNSSEYLRSALMPGVFFEYFSLNNINVQPDKKFFPRNKKNYKISINFSDVAGKPSTVEINSVDNQHFLTCNGKEPKLIFPEFEINVLNSNDPNYCINCLENGNIAYFHPKTSGNVSNGFWIDFKIIDGECNLKLFFKELYCFSQRFETEQREIVEMYKSQKISAYGTLIKRQGQKLVVRKVTDKDIIEHGHMHSNSYTYTRYSTIPPEVLFINSGIYFMNEYVELSGYFLLEMFDMMPQMNAFYSEFYGKPMLAVKEIDTSKFQLISYQDNNTKVRYDFNRINNDPYAMFMSAIPIQSLRLIQMIFLVDDYHEGNLAISIAHKKLKDPTNPEIDIPIEFIERIQAFDIWPTRHNLNVASLFMKNDLSKYYSQCSFDELILSRLDNMEEQQWEDLNRLKLIFQDPKGKVIELKHDNPVYQESIKRLNAYSLTPDQSLGKIYGKKILHIHYGAENRRKIISFYAMTNLFDEFYFKNHQYFDKIKTFESQICVNIALEMLKATYKRSTQETHALQDIFHFDKDLNSETLKETIVNSDWIKYMFHVARTIESIIKIFRESFFSLVFLDIKEVYELEIVIPESAISRKEYVIKEVYFNRLLTINTSTIVGLSFIYEFPTIENSIKLFKLSNDASKQFDQIRAYENSILTTKKTKFFVVRSPLVFDILKSMMDSLFRIINSDKLPLKNMYQKRYN